MSDALTDIARDEKRGRLHDAYLESIRQYLLKPNEKNKQKVIKEAQEVDGVRGGYFGGPTHIAMGVEARLANLKDGDKDTWGRFLSGVTGENRKALKELSPFAGKLLIFVDYGRGFVTLSGEIESYVASLIHRKGLKTYDCDDYLIALDVPQAGAEVQWLRCGRSDVKGPRKSGSGE